jgi:hypothetical protein
MQGIGYFYRSALKLVTPNYDIRQYMAPSEPSNKNSEVVMWLDTSQVAIGNYESSRDIRSTDDQPREQTDWLFGTVTNWSRLIDLDEVDDEFLKDGWLVEGEGKTFIITVTKHKDRGYTATQIGGFRMIDGQRYHCLRIVLHKGRKRAEAQLVFDFVY